MALAGELAKYIGNEVIKTSGKELAKAGAQSALSNLVPSIATKALSTTIPVAAAKSVLQSIPVSAGNNIKLFRGISAESPEKLQKYIGDMMDPSIKPQTYAGGGAYGEGYYFSPYKDSAESYATNDLNKPYQAILEINPSKNRFIGINKANANRPVDFAIRAEERGVPGGRSGSVGERDFANYLDRNGILGNRASEGTYVVTDNSALSGMKIVGRRGPDKVWDYSEEVLPEKIKEIGADKYLPKAPTQIKFNKDLSIRKTGGNFGHKGVKGMRGGSAPKGLDEYGMGKVDLSNLNEPKIQQSIIDNPTIIYHGTPNKFEDFDENLPSVWFTNNKDTIKDTGLSWDGKGELNVMERILPNNLKLADWDTADRLTQQQMIDRGYDGVIYDEGDGSDIYYEIFNPNKSLKKVSRVQNESLTEIAKKLNAMKASRDMSDGIKRIGSAEVAALNEGTLPEGWKQLEKYLDTADNRLEKAIGKPRSKITKQDLITFLEDYGYDTEGTKNDLWKNALMCIDDMALDDLYNAGGAAGMFLQDRLPFRHNDKLTDATNYYIGAKGRTGRLDAEYSDRLGIGRSNTPMSDRLVNPYSGAGGDYSKGAFGTADTWSSGESGVSTVAHERMHAWQDINKFDWDEEVGDAIDELRGELKKFYHDEDTIKKYWGNSKTDYYMEDIEQEARMLQNYLDNEGYTNTYRKTYEKGTEWGDEIKPAFDKFFDKLRKLSKKGVALPAIAGLVGIGGIIGASGDKKEKTY